MVRVLRAARCQRCVVVCVLSLLPETTPLTPPPPAVTSPAQFDETQGDSKEQYGGGGRAVDAASVMSNISAAESIRSVHSKRSLQAVINREKSRMAPSGGLPIISESGAASAQALPQPRIVTHDDTGGSRITKKDLISQLPYMNRNPAV